MYIKNEIPKAEEGRAQQMLSQLYFYYMDHVDELPQEYLNFLDAGEKSLQGSVRLHSRHE